MTSVFLPKKMLFALFAAAGIFATSLAVTNSITSNSNVDTAIQDNIIDDEHHEIIDNQTIDGERKLTAPTSYDNSNWYLNYHSWDPYIANNDNARKNLISVYGTNPDGFEGASGSETSAAGINEVDVTISLIAAALSIHNWDNLANLQEELFQIAGVNIRVGYHEPFYKKTTANYGNNDRAIVALINNVCYVNYPATAFLSINDWSQNLRKTPTNIPKRDGTTSNCKAGKGFVDAFEKTKEWLFDENTGELHDCMKGNFAINSCVEANCPVVFSGHSQGASVAAIAAHYWALERVEVPYLVTFSMPPTFYNTDSTKPHKYPDNCRINTSDHTEKERTIQWVGCGYEGGTVDLVAQINFGQNYPNAEVGPLVYLNDKHGNYVSTRYYREDYNARWDHTFRAHCLTTDYLPNPFTERTDHCPLIAGMPWTRSDAGIFDRLRNMLAKIKANNNIAMTVPDYLKCAGWFMCENNMRCVDPGNDGAYCKSGNGHGGEDFCKGDKTGHVCSGKNYDPCTMDRHCISENCPDRKNKNRNCRA